MGASGVYLPRVKTREQFFQAELVRDFFIDDVIDHAVKGTVIYVAVHTPDGAIVAHVITTRKAPDGWWFYKAVPESAGPCEDKCPLRILRLLTDPAPGDWAQQWRERCRSQFKRR